MIIGKDSKKNLKSRSIKAEKALFKKRKSKEDYIQNQPTVKKSSLFAKTMVQGERQKTDFFKLKTSQKTDFFLVTA